MISPALASKFPKLIADGARETSPEDNDYNCLAWSANRDNTRWWQPGGMTGTFWPDGMPEDDYECFIVLFERRGYKKDTNPRFEILQKKVAIYGTLDAFGQLQFTHVCDELNSGAWTSKLGPFEDIQHNSLEALEGNIAFEYGKVSQILRKRCNAKEILARLFFKIRRYF
jgi:hypothetical protein